jgi:AcrR family transcriptional regulator
VVDGVTGRRERKKAQTRAAIAASAARLFARSGFQGVTMLDVAQDADVSEQTVYNHFPTKEALVFDRAGDLGYALLNVVTGRPSGTGLVDAYDEWLRTSILGDSARRSISNPGGMPRLVATDASLRRHLLDLADGWANDLAHELAAREAVELVTARTLADALLHVYVRIVDRLGAAETELQLNAIHDDASRALNALRPAFAALGPGRLA